MKKVIWASWCKGYRSFGWFLWKTKENAHKGKKENYSTGLIATALCDLPLFLNTRLNKRKVYKITVTEG